MQDKPPTKSAKLWSFSGKLNLGLGAPKQVQLRRMCPLWYNRFEVTVELLFQREQNQQEKRPKKLIVERIHETSEKLKCTYFLCQFGVKLAKSIEKTSVKHTEFPYLNTTSMRTLCWGDSLREKERCVISLILWFGLAFDLSAVLTCQAWPSSICTSKKTGEDVDGSLSEGQKTSAPGIRKFTFPICLPPEFCHPFVCGWPTPFCW